jgi:hypothetical protein
MKSDKHRLYEKHGLFHGSEASVKEYSSPQLETFEYDSSGYYYDKATGFYFDPRSEHFYDPTQKQWMFWYSKYERYFPCDGGDFRMKKEIQDTEREKLLGPVALALKGADKPVPASQTV